ncbi:MAG TPA: CoA pyrophosphatase [Rubricoccaceae bacterium]
MSDYDTLVAALRARLAVGRDGNTVLPGYAAHAEMAPFPSRTDPAVISVEGKAGRAAATLVLLYPDAAGAPCLVLTVRQPSLRAHSGQVSLPGGAVEPGETAEDAARREAHEEIGVEVADVLGRLTPLYVPPSGFSVWPVVAALSARPDFQVQEREVSELVEVPVALLLDAGARQRRPRTLRGNPLVEDGATLDVPFFALGGHEVWGATAMMLAEFAAVVQAALAPEPDR